MNNMIYQVEIIEEEHPMDRYYEGSTWLKSPNNNSRSGMGIKDMGGPANERPKEIPTLQDYYLLAADDFLSNSKKIPSYRVGQSLFNCLYKLRKDLAEKIVRTDCNPFYDGPTVEQRIKNFILFIEKEWHK